MNDENNNINPFGETNTDSNLKENNKSEYVDFGSSFSTDNQERTFFNEDINSEPSNNYYEEDNNYYEEDNNNSNNEQETFYNQSNKDNSFVKKIPIILAIIVLIILLVIVIKSLFNTEEPIEDINENPTVEINNTDEKTLYKKLIINTSKLANGNVLLQLNNKNKISIDAEITVEFYNKDGDTIEEESVSVKNVPAKGIYYEMVSVKPELKDLEHIFKAKVKANKFKEYFLDKVEVTNRTEEEDRLMVEVKNDSYSTIDVIEVYAIYYDDDSNIIGFDKSLVNKLVADKTGNVKLNYPKDKEYKYIGFSDYIIGINTAYSYQNNKE